MGFETSPPNEFRATMRSGRKPLVVTAKKARVDPTAEGLGAVRVPRSETRRTDQRGGDRYRLGEEQAIVRRKGRKHLVELINISHGGAMVRGKFPAKLWDRVDLVLGEASKAGGTIECAVRWIRGDRIGLEFAHETRVDCDAETYEKLLRDVLRSSFPKVEIKDRAAHTEAADDTRTDLRHSLVWNGTLHHDYEWEIVRLRNVSTQGALIECTASLPSGVTVFLDLGAAGRIRATVQWSRGGQSGLDFSEPFDVSRLAMIAPEIAAADGSRPSFAGEGESDQSPWAPEWERLSVDELGANLGG